MLVYRKMIDLCVWTLSPTILLQSLISSVHFSVDSFGVSVLTTLSSRNKGSFTSSLPCYMPFISFSCLIALAGISSMMLKGSGDGGILTLLLILVKSVFSSLSMMLAVGGLIDILYQVEKVLCSWFTESFYHEWVSNFVKCFFFIYW